tara:strand:- start:4152 stop:4376 length:225 start_codon:yes stop_codon:yes gene_type:complete
MHHKEINMGRNYTVMNQGYYYDEGKNIGYTITVKGCYRLYFSNVAYHSKGQLINQLINDGYKKENIESSRSTSS